MKYTNRMICGLAAFVAGYCAAIAAGGLQIDHLGTNNTLVRVTDNSQRYLLLPVEEAVDDATVNILLNGKPESTIYVKLAHNKVDYFVPLDISRYGDNAVVLNVVTAQSRQTVREIQNDVCWKDICLSDTFDTTNREKYRPAFHHTPLYGWMNDPNGMFYKDGTWHLYYQCNPYGSKWQNMTWGHSSSTDLVHWQHHPNAIEPNGLGAVFSGSAVIDRDNTAGFGNDAIVALYTSAGVNQIQSLASSTDNGMTFDIYPGNPVLTLDSEARDPNMFWNDKTGEWNLILAHALDHEMLLFTSPDLKKWTLQSAFGKGLGAQGGVWECPDLFELPVDGDTCRTKWVLLCNINPGGPFGGSGIQYFTGDFDGKTFTADTDASGKVPTKWLDYGKDNYAIVSWSDAPDNRRTAIGWMSNWQYAAEVPTKQFRSANTLPRDISLFTGADGQVYAASAPSPELDAMRGQITTSVKSASIGKSPRKYPLPAVNDGICEIMLEMDPGNARSMSVTLMNPAGEKVVMTYSPDDETLSMDRRESGITDFSQDFPTVTVAPTFNDDKTLHLRLFVDRASIEAFANGGRGVMTNLVFPTSPYDTLSISADGASAKIKNLRIYSINLEK